MNLCSDCERWDPLANKCTAAPFRKAMEVIECDKYKKQPTFFDKEYGGTLCDRCKFKRTGFSTCMIDARMGPMDKCVGFEPSENFKEESANDPVNSPNHYVGKIECIDYLRDKLTPAEFTGFCMGNVLKYCSRWRKKDGVQDLHKAKVYLEWAIENEEKRT